MQELNDILNVIDGYLGSAPWFAYLLLGTGLFFTIYLGFPQIRYFRHAIRVVSGKYDKESDTGDASHFQALATALSGTVGTGNIAGVAFAVHLGGPAALFWMLMTAMLGMTTKFVEVTLSHKYREKADDGSIAGGPMYYMKNKLNMKWMAALFAVATVISCFGTGNLPQMNSIANSLYSTFGINKMLVGAVLAVLLGVVIVGGIKRIAQVTEKLVPAMAGIYLIGALGVLVYNYENIIPAFISIFTDVFNGSAAAGGFLGAGFSYAFSKGVARGLFSNESGQGSAPIAHAAARTEEPVSEGTVAILEPFIDTVVICMLTGLVLLSSGVWTEKLPNIFQNSDMQVLAAVYDDKNPEDVKKLYDHLSPEGQKLPVYSGKLQVSEGLIQGAEISIINSRSIAEEVLVYTGDPKQLFSGEVEIKEGRTVEVGVTFEGKSLLHSAPLSAEAFKRSIFGDWGKYIVSIGLLLFAFSTTISWSYYGDRAIIYLVGAKGLLPFRIAYVLAFFWASFADTTIIWTLAGIAIAMMTIPNLVGILLLHKDVKQTIADYWVNFRKNHPNG